MMPYRFHAAAETEYYELLEWYDSHQTGLGNDAADDFEAFMGLMRRWPTMYAKVEGCPADWEVRIGATVRKSIVVIYEVLAEEIQILSVTHANAGRRVWRKRVSNKEEDV